MYECICTYIYIHFTFCHICILGFSLELFLFYRLQFVSLSADEWHNSRRGTGSTFLHIQYLHIYRYTYCIILKSCTIAHKAVQNSHYMQMYEQLVYMEYYHILLSLSLSLYLPRLLLQPIDLGIYKCVWLGRQLRQWGTKHTQLKIFPSFAYV